MNILLHYENEEDRQNNNLFKAQIKISDFGFSRFLGPQEQAQSTLGTPFYADPKIFLSDGVQKYGKDVDIWSIGVLSYQLLTGELPFVANNLKGLKQRVHEDGSFTIYSNTKCSEDFLSFLNCTLQKDSDSRWDMNKLIRHRFIVKPFDQFKPLPEERKDYDGDVTSNVNMLSTSLLDSKIWIDESVPQTEPSKRQFIKSVFIPCSCILFCNSSPVKPAIKPRAVFSIPKFFTTVDTLRPFPPGNIFSSCVLFIFPISNLSTVDM